MSLTEHHIRVAWIDGNRLNRYFLAVPTDYEVRRMHVPIEVEACFFEISEEVELPQSRIKTGRLELFDKVSVDVDEMPHHFRHNVSRPSPESVF
ncbi:hypothetical protein BamMEX5DRAFT_5198 [Burkholderia ambifaria MEX-5]|uniref:Uncharacterized protein n=1 Tax=Burkholderia ambifaria MEX-5 TaxID=396597 RepID=B1TBN2_9BURK|nr:hypothetical protein BamMEX5DRAFT_5198 [Burkholderia ambifaria MEX-5]